jgi:hypothetical protein
MWDESQQKYFDIEKHIIVIWLVGLSVGRCVFAHLSLHYQTKIHFLQHNWCELD